jgi:fatty acid-binding protein DegV
MLIYQQVLVLEEFMNKFKVVADSGSDLLSLESIAFACAPLKIRTAENEYVDDETLNVKEMVENLLVYKGFYKIKGR